MSEQYLLDRIKQLEEENSKLRERNLELEKRTVKLETGLDVMEKLLQAKIN